MKRIGLQHHIKILVGACLFFIATVFLPTYVVSSNIEYENTVLFYAQNGTDVIVNGEFITDFPVRITEATSISIENDGLGELLFPNKNIVRLGDNTKISLEPKTSEIHISQGKIWVNNQKPEFKIHAHETLSYIADGTMSLEMDEKKVTVTSLYKYFEIGLYNAETAEIIRTHAVPTKHSVTIYKNQIKDHYKALSAKKLKKEIRQNIVYEEDYDDWIKQNTLLDNTTNSQFESTPFSSIAYQIRNSINNTKRIFTFVENKKVELASSILEVKYESAVRSLKHNIDADMYIQELSDSIDNTSLGSHALSTLYKESAHQSQNKIYDITKLIFEKYSAKITNKNDKNTLNIFHLKQLINFLEESTEIKNKTLSSKISRDISTIISGMSVQLSNYNEVDDVRNMYYGFMLSYSHSIDQSLLEIYNNLANFQSQIAQNKDQNIYQDFLLEILESKIRLANGIIEKSRRYSFALNYLDQENITQKITNIPTSIGAKQHLEELEWVVRQKGNEYLHSDSNIKDEDFVSYIKKQKNIDDLNEELRESIQEDKNEKTENEIISTEKIQTIIRDFHNIEISIEENNVTYIQGTNDKYLISNILYLNTVFNIKYNAENDTIYELQIQGSNRTFNSSFKRESLPLVILEQESPSIYADNDILNNLASETTSEDEAEILQQKIVQSDLKKWDIYAQSKNISPLLGQYQTYQVNNARVLNEPVNFVYDRARGIISQLYIITTEDRFEEIFDPSEIVIEVESIKRREEQEERLKQSLINEFLNQNITIDIQNLVIEADTFDTATFKNATFEIGEDEYDVNGSIKISERMFINIQGDNFNFSNIAISSFTETFLKNEIKEVLNEQSFGLSDLEYQFEIDQNTVYIQGFKYEDVSLECELRINDYHCKDVMIDGIPLNGTASYQNFETIRKTIEEKIQAEQERKEQELFDQLNENLEAAEEELDDNKTNTDSIDGLEES